MFYLLYNLLSIILLVPVIVYHLYRSVSRRRPPALAERFGFHPPGTLASVAGRPVIWLHAVSVGEAIASRPLLKALRRQYPEHALVVSTTTETGRATATGFPEKDLCIYFPFDFLPGVRRVLDQVRPEVIIIMETEIWPNFTREARRRDIPVILANGRISDRSFTGYLRFSWFFRQPLNLFSRLCMQTDADCERIIAIGAPADRTVRAGNLKYDIPYRQVDEAEKCAIRASYRIPPGSSIITAGSTHDGEEGPLIEAFRELLRDCPDLLLILVPRHPERAAIVSDLLDRAGFRWQRRSALDEGDMFHGGEILLVDTIGELLRLYAMSDVAFVGGSLVPTGGHNLLEPASVGVPSVFGPHMSNFREITELVLHYGAGVQVSEAGGIAAALRTMIGSPDLRRVLGQNGLKLMRDNGGAAERHLAAIAEFL